ncbi:unnamed protein product [Porites lobata]|uniref:Uncharacterized protein n=1 Tax=Porites lobata TaxID=104759 RepID=A0ABN8RGF0_9CNID|nr:unnamed protein product [Porites lobata]
MPVTDPQRKYPRILWRTNARPSSAGAETSSKHFYSCRGRSHGPHKFYIPVVPRRHSFDERIFAIPSAKGNSGESLLTRESIGKEAELEMKLAIVSNALMKEGEEKHRLDSELRKLQKENKRLQEDLRTASHQLRKFTEWFFASIEPSNR